MNLLERCKIVPACDPTAGGEGAQTATEVNCTGFDRVMYVFSLGAASTGGTFDAHIHEAAATGMEGAANITGAELTQVADTGGSAVYAIDVPVNAAKPFQIPVIAVGTADIANGAVAILYNGTGTYPKTAATQAVVI